MKYFKQFLISCAMLLLVVSSAYSSMPISVYVVPATNIIIDDPVTQITAIEKNRNRLERYLEHSKMVNKIDGNNRNPCNPTYRLKMTNEVSLPCKAKE